MSRVLILEDDPDSADLIDLALTSSGYTCAAADNARQATQMLEEQEYDLLIGSLSLLNFSGDFTEDLRMWQPNLAIIVLCSPTECDLLTLVERESVSAVLIKPVDRREVLRETLRAVLERTRKIERERERERLRKLLLTSLEPVQENSGSDKLPRPARRQKSVVPVLQIGDMIVDVHQTAVTYRGQQLDLTPTQFEILHLLAQNPERIVTFEDIAYHLYETPFSRAEARKNLSAHLSYLRARMREAGCEHYLINSRGRGYLLSSGSPQRLRRNEHLLGLIASQFPVIVYTTDRALRLTSLMGREMEEMGESMKQYIGMSLYDLFPGSATVITENKRVLTGESTSYEQTWDGRVYTLYTEPLRDEDDQIIGVIGAALDITERKRAEDALREREEFYRMVMEDASDAIVITDIQGNFIDFNPGYCKLLGYTREEILEHNAFSFIHPADNANFGELMPRLYAGEVIYHERRLQHKNGRMIRAEGSARLLRDGSKIMIIVREIHRYPDL